MQESYLDIVQFVNDSFGAVSNSCLILIPDKLQMNSNP